MQGGTRDDDTANIDRFEHRPGVNGSRPANIDADVEEFGGYSGFLDARIRYERVKSLLESITGLEQTRVQSYDLIPGDAVVREFIGGSTIKIPHNE